MKMDMDRLRNIYRDFSTDRVEELLSNYLIERWSYSAVNTFARNEKAFEMQYIYNERSRSSASTIAGSAYHEALEWFFNDLKEGVQSEPAMLNAVAQDYIDNFAANLISVSRTLPTVEAVKTEAMKQANTLVASFLKEKSVYTENMGEIFGVEMSLEQWVCINGVSIPLPLKAKLDLVTDEGNKEVIIWDHKGKRAYTPEEEISLVRGKQAATYTAAFETAFPEYTVREVRFVENKTSVNKDGSPQLKCFSIVMDDNTRKLYEALLYEPLKRMLEATSDPDYIYVTNDSDSLTDKGELYRFWMATLINETEGFEMLPERRRKLLQQRRRKIRDASLVGLDPKIITEFRRKAADFISYDYNTTDMTNTEKIEHILRTFNLPVKVSHEIEGFSCNTYLLEVAAGVKMANIFKYRMDIANALNVPSVRIPSQLVLYRDRSYLAIETARTGRREPLPLDGGLVSEGIIPLGLDNYLQPVVWNLNNHATPHVLVCGATGSGKSVCIKTMIASARAAGVGKVIIMDPKMEFTGTPGCEVHSDIREIEEGMKELVEDMQQRVKSGIRTRTLVIFDEFADAVAASRSGRELDIAEEVVTGRYRDGREKVERKVTGRDKSLEENLRILLQKGRSLGFRIVAATQRASAKVITGDAKVNFPVQICFRVPKEIDSKVVIDEAGAESLAGYGDGLIKSPEFLTVTRFQGFYVD